MGDQEKLKEILKMSLKLTDQELKDFDPANIAEERKEWLQKAIENILEDDDGKKLIAYTNMFLSFEPEENLTDNQLTDLVNIFEGINFLCEGFEMAKDFDQLGGVLHCLNFLKSQYTSLQWRAADLIANCVHHNPKVQENIMSHNGTEKLFYTLKTSDIEIVQVKCLYALSALFENFESAQQLFVKLQGIDFVLKLLKENTGKLQLKSAFLLQKFVWNNVKFKDLDYEHIFNILMQLFKEDLQDDTHSIAINCIVHLIKNDNLLFNLYQSKYKEQYQDLLKTRIKRFNIDKEQYDNEIKLYDELMLL